MTFSLTSTAFTSQSAIPSRFTCEGEDISPPLVFGGVPAGAKSLALIVDDPDAPDPDAPRTVWVHWVLYDMPPSTRELAENASHAGLPEGTREGINDWKRLGYGGPCPPIGKHRYFFKLYALDAMLGDLRRPTKQALLRAMEPHVLASAELVGTYAKARGR